MRIFNKSLAVAACVAAVTFGAVAPPAYAGVTLYENANYDWGPTMSTGETKHLGWMSDRASSIKNHNHKCSWRYFEDINHRGRNFCIFFRLQLSSRSKPCGSPLGRDLG